jgi:hypothetical protein
MSEQRIEQQFVRWCERNQLPCLKLVLQGQRGWPDRTILLPSGRIAVIEFKTDDGVVSPQQRYWLERLTQLGFANGVARSKEEAIRIVEAI